jgi:hypothetical protein
MLSLVAGLIVFGHRRASKLYIKKNRPTKTEQRALIWFWRENEKWPQSGHPLHRLRPKAFQLSADYR